MKLGGEHAHDLVVGEVPRLNHEHDTGGLLDVVGLAGGVVQGDGSQQLFGVVGEVVGDVCAQLHLGAGLAHQLAHVQGQVGCQGVLVLTEELGDLTQLCGTVTRALLLAPGLVEIMTAGQGILQVLVGGIGVGFDKFIIKGIDSLIGHNISFE